MRPSLPSLIALIALVSGCNKDAPTTGECVPDLTFFDESVWRAFMASDCATCHSAQGAASGSGLVFESSTLPLALENTFALLKDYAGLERNGVPLLLLKPSGQVAHGGGTLFSESSQHYAALQSLIGRFDAPSNCATVPTIDIYQGVRFLSPQATFRKAALMVNGRLPTADEHERIDRDGLDALPDLINAMLQEEAFYQRLIEVFNDAFLTDEYLGGDKATNLLNADDYPDKGWYRALDESQMNAEIYQLQRYQTNAAVARAPLELVAHLAREDRPFSQIVTADYMMVNPLSARVYGVNTIHWPDPLDITDWREVQLPGVPHAGVLTSPIWLNRFPTTATNVNRHRSRMVYSFFLATDIMALASRPVDPTQIADFNPTMYTQDCIVCHATLDPVAGAFQNWDARGRYAPPEGGWNTDMRPPGFDDQPLPSSEWPASLQWLGARIAQTKRFDLSITQLLFEGLTGQAPLKPPQNEEAGNLSDRQAAYEAQHSELIAIAAAFRADDQNVKTLVRSLLLSQAFRAESLGPTFNGDEGPIDALGTARWLSPELLNRKIIATTGVTWKPNWSPTPYLLNPNSYLIYYGGINSVDITTRISEPNGMMAAVALRMANEVSCLATPYDLSLPPEQRSLLPLVEASFTPEDVNGFQIPASIQAIKENIVHLHQQLLGETLPLDHPEIEATYQLFLQTWREGSSRLPLGEVPRNLPGTCRVYQNRNTGEDLAESDYIVHDDTYSIRSWMAVVSYLLMDHRFLTD